MPTWEGGREEKRQEAVSLGYDAFETARCATANICCALGRKGLEWEREVCAALQQTWKTAQLRLI